MNSQITLLALAGKCCGLDANGFAKLPLRACSCPRREVKAAIPNPAPDLSRNSRRENERSRKTWRSRLACCSLSSIDIDKLTGVKQRQAKLEQPLSTTRSQEGKAFFYLL